MNYKLRVGEKLAIGLKNKLAIQIASLLALVIVFIFLSLFYLFQKEQWDLIDQRIETTATLLLKSNLSQEDLNDLEKAHYFIQSTLGKRPFNLFIRIFTSEFGLLYSVGETLETPYPFSRDETWKTHQMSDGSQTRTLLVALPSSSKRSPERLLQVGLIVGDELLGMNHVQDLIIPVGIAICLLVYLITWFSARSFLNPLQDMTLS